MDQVRFMSVASGSKGNCYYLATPHAQILIDCGIGIRRLVRDLALNGIDATQLDAVLVTHLHSDHICGLAPLLKRAHARVYVHERALGGLAQAVRLAAIEQATSVHNLGLPYDAEVVGFGINGGFPHRDIDVLPVPVSHDCDPTVGFKLYAAGVRIGVLTDLGTYDDALRAQFADCHLLLLESNHCPEMLANGPYPEVLKRRIRGKEGHLSNAQAVEFVTGLPSLPARLLLGHLSEVNNHPQVVSAAFTRIETGAIPHLVVTQEETSPLFEVSP